MKPSLKYKQILEIQRARQAEERAKKLKISLARKEELNDLHEKIKNETDVVKRHQMTTRHLKLLGEIYEEDRQAIELQEQNARYARVKEHEETLKRSAFDLQSVFKPWLEDGIILGQDHPFVLTLPEALSALPREPNILAIQACFEEINKDDDAMEYYFTYNRETEQKYTGGRPCVEGWKPPPPRRVLASIHVSIRMKSVR